MEKIQLLLKEHGDIAFADFQAKLIPTVERDRIIGVRTPVIRAIAKELLGDKDFQQNGLPIFLEELPHEYFDENALHGEFISKEKDFFRAVELTEKFLPYIDNWAVCDLLDPKVFAKHKSEMAPMIEKWLGSPEIYTVRFGIDMMIKHFLNEDFQDGHLRAVLNADGDDYYIKMAKAWYFSFAFIKQYEPTLKFFRSENIDEWIFKKSVQKAKESYRLTAEQKDEIRSLLKHRSCI